MTTANEKAAGESSKDLGRYVGKLVTVRGEAGEAWRVVSAYWKAGGPCGDPELWVHLVAVSKPMTPNRHIRAEDCLHWMGPALPLYVRPRDKDEVRVVMEGMPGASGEKQEGEPPFATGDVVRLRSGGPRMTVGRIIPDFAVCYWFPFQTNANGFPEWPEKHGEGEFAVEALVRVAEPPSGVNAGA